MWGIPIQINWEWFLARKAILQILHKMGKLQTIQPHHKETLSKPPRKVFKKSNDAIANFFKTVQTSLMQSCIIACLPLPSCYRYSLLSVSLCYSILILLLITLHCSFRQERLLGKPWFLFWLFSSLYGKGGHVYRNCFTYWGYFWQIWTRQKFKNYLHPQKSQPVTRNPFMIVKKPNRGTDGGTS